MDFSYEMLPIESQAEAEEAYWEAFEASLEAEFRDELVYGHATN